LSIPSDLRDRALDLSPNDRAELAHQLLQSLDPEGAERDPGYEDAWAAELETRMREVEEGRANLLTWEEVKERLRHPSSQGREP